MDGQDKIYLSTIDANTVLAGNQAFSLIAAMGTATSAVGTGRVGWYQFNSANNALDRTFLRVNNDADGLIEMTIELKGLVNISAVNGVDIFF